MGVSLGLLTKGIFTWTVDNWDCRYEGLLTREIVTWTIDKLEYRLVDVDK